MVKRTEVTHKTPEGKNTFLKDSKKKKIFEVPHWTYMMIEAFCCVNHEYRSKHSKWCYGFKWNEDPEKRDKFPNPNYDPKAKPNKKPKHCTGNFSLECIKCKHLAYSDVDEGLKKKMRKTIRKYEEKG